MDPIWDICFRRFPSGNKEFRNGYKRISGSRAKSDTSIDVPGDEVIARGIVKNDTNHGGSKRLVHTLEIFTNPPREHSRNDKLTETTTDHKCRGKATWEGDISQVEDHSITETVHVSEDKVRLLYMGAGRRLNVYKMNLVQTNY